MEATKEFFTPEELVARWRDKISLETLVHWRREGMGPPHTKVGGRILYPVTGVLEYERSRTEPRPPKRATA
jgi:hypothetical protein